MVGAIWDQRRERRTVPGRAGSVHAGEASIPGVRGGAEAVGETEWGGPGWWPRGSRCHYAPRPQWELGLKPGEREGVGLSELQAHVWRTGRSGGGWSMRWTQRARERSEVIHAARRSSGHSEDGALTCQRTIPADRRDEVQRPLLL